MKNLNYKIMRKLVFALLMLLTLSLKAQFKEVVRFMGIPVDGPKSEMISKLEKKGFTYNKKEDWLEGRFNGEDVSVFVHTNNELVDRIMVATSNPVSETDIKIKFNTLVRQFENNDKYMPAEEDQCIGEDVNISYEMSVKKKRFQASFHQCYTKEEIDVIRPYINDNYEILMEAFNQSFSDFMEEEGIAFGDDREENVNGLLMLFSLYYAINNDVWFMISESNRYNYYNINIYYDNLSNRPNGEDL
jgi:hypothetical protein